mmetsp:Transcript_35373/g.35902  ORF Transcript_35373/g.35902 Transcript_35373/m.35902 type:complete len:82 (+) Transcript_35373:42-287(+)
MEKKRCIDLRASIEVLVDQVALSVGTAAGVGAGDDVDADDRSEETGADDNAVVSSILSLRLLLLPIEDDDDDDDDTTAKFT